MLIEGSKNSSAERGRTLGFWGRFEVGASAAGCLMVRKQGLLEQVALERLWDVLRIVRGGVSVEQAFAEHLLAAKVAC